MRFVVFFFCVAIHLFGASLLTYNIYEREDRVDMMLSFDAPYEGQIFQQRGSNLTSLTLLGLNFDDVIEKGINSNIVQEFSIEPTENGLVVTLKSKNPIGVYASKTVDGFGLRIRSQLMAPVVGPTPLPKSISSSSNAPNNSLVLPENYIMVIGIMLILLIFLFWLKSKIKHRQIIKPPKNKSSWLFQGNKQSEEFHVISQKALDANNKIVLINFHSCQYLAIVGTTNVLLDKIGTKDVKNDDEFEAIFEKNRQKLDSYLKLQQNSKLDSYKEKVGGEYTVFNQQEKDS